MPAAPAPRAFRWLERWIAPPKGSSWPSETLLIVVNQRRLRIHRLLRNVTLGQKILTAREVHRVVSERFLRLAHCRFVSAQRIDTLRNRKRALEDGVNGVGVIAVCRRKIGLQLRLQITGVEQRQDLPGMHGVALAYIDGVGRLREAALDGNVLVGRDDAGQLPGGLDAAVSGDRRLHVRGVG